MRYPVVLTPDTGGFVVELPDIPEAITQGDTHTEALLMARDVLESALDFYFGDRRPVPLPSPVETGQEFVELSPQLCEKILQFNKML